MGDRLLRDQGQDEGPEQDWKAHRSQWHLPHPIHAAPFFSPHLPMEQSCPVQLGSQLQSPVSGRKVPWPEHWSRQVALGVSQLVPPQPTEQWHSPLTQTPRPEHVGSTQSTVTRGERARVRTGPPRLGASLHRTLCLHWGSFTRSRRGTQMSMEVLITRGNREENDSGNSRPGFLTPPSGQLFISRGSLPPPVKHGYILPPLGLRVQRARHICP